MVERTGDAAGRTIRSVEIALDIVEALQVEAPKGVTAIADELGHSKSTIYSHLQTLVEREVLVREGDSYRLSLRTLDVARHVREQVGNYDVIRDEVDDLAAQTGEIAQFGIEEHGEVAYLCKASGEQAVETRSSVGTYQPLYCTSLGKTILAHLPAEQRDALVDEIEFEQRTPRTITSDEALQAALQQIRERGYGIDDEENIEGLRCVSAPVVDGERVLGAISITGPARRFTTERMHGDLREHVQRAANVIELNTKFS